MSPQLRTWLRVIIDYGALVAFGVAYLIARLHHAPDALISATPTLMIGSVIAIVAGYLLEKRVAPMPLTYGAFALVFGSLTLIFHDARILQMKATFAYLAFAIALGAGLVLKRNPLRALLGSSIVMDDAAWRTLTIRYALFFVASAALNELVWRTQSHDFWVTYKLVYFVVVLIFSFAQAPFLMKHMQQDDAAPKVPEPPDSGF